MWLLMRLGTLVVAESAAAGVLQLGSLSQDTLVLEPGSRMTFAVAVEPTQSHQS